MCYLVLAMLLYFNMSLSLVSWQRSFFKMSFTAINIYFCWGTDSSACEHIYLCHNLQVPELWKFICSVQFRLLSLEHHRTNYYYYSISNLCIECTTLCPASLKSFSCFYFWCILYSQWKGVIVNLQILHCQL